MGNNEGEGKWKRWRRVDLFHVFMYLYEKRAMKMMEERI
jgi:hypothetical protein